jgi:hypothetical protein
MRSFLPQVLHTVSAYPIYMQIKMFVKQLVNVFKEKKGWGKKQHR